MLYTKLLPTFIFTDEDRPPLHQPISPEEKEEKEHRVFNAAADVLETVYWTNVTHDGQPVTVSHVPSGEEDSFYGDFDHIHDIISNGKSLALMERHPAVYDEYKYTISHVDRRIGMSIFLNCDRPDCGPCASRPPIRNPRGVEIIKNIPTPIPSPDAALRDEHFATYMEARDLPREPPCSHMPSVQRLNLGRCEQGCKYVFASAADKDNHRRKMHPLNGRRGRGRAARGAANGVGNRGGAARGRGRGRGGGGRGRGRGGGGRGRDGRDAQ